MINTLNHIPLLRLLLPFIGGIVGAIYIKPNTTYLLYGFGVAAVLFLTLLLIKKFNSSYKLRSLFGTLIYINLAMAGACLTSLKYQNTDKTSKLLTEQNNQLLIGEVVEPTQVKARSIKTILNIKRIKNNSNWTAINAKVVIYLQKDSLSNQLGVGDIISMEPKLKNVPPPKNPKT